MASTSTEPDSRFVYLHAERLARSYEPSFFSRESRFVTENHARVEDLVRDIRGKLEPADHYKLYEAGYFARGTVLEIGRLLAKSTILLALGLSDGDGVHQLVSIEYEDRYLEFGRRNLAQFNVLDRVQLVQGDSSQVVASLPGTFDTVFVDGDHSYDGVHRDIDALAGRIDPGGVVMFHDYFHPLNDSGEYGVTRAVDECRDELGLEFRGRFGGIALFERRAHG
jgi:predicted O-methyltransferase YrrM